MHLQEAFRGKRVFIAGRGFYGEWFRRYFEAIGSAVTIASSRNHFNIADPATHPLVLHEADYVINAAGNSCETSPVALLNIHGSGPIRLFAGLKPGACGLQISSGAATGNTPYGRAKLMAELGLSLMPRDVQIVRAFNTVGPGMGLDKPFAISTFIKRALAGQPLEAAPGISRTFCHIEDLMVQMLHVLALGDRKTPYDVGSEDELSMVSAAKIISNDVTMIDKPYASNSGAASYRPDLGAIKSLCEHPVVYPSNRAISLTFDHYRNESTALPHP